MGNAIPLTSSSSIVFRYIRSLRSFDTRSYSPAMTGGRMGVDEVNRTVGEIMEVTRAFIQKNLTATYIHLAVVLVLLVIYIIIVSSTAYEDASNIWVTFLIYIVLIVISSAVFTNYAQNNRQQARILAQNIINRENQSTMPRGLTWYLPEKFPLWIELQVQYQAQNQGVYVPPVNYGGYPNQGVQGDAQNQEYQQHYYAATYGNNANNNANAFNPYNPQQGFNPQQGYNAQPGYNPNPGF